MRHVGGDALGTIDVDHPVVGVVPPSGVSGLEGHLAHDLGLDLELGRAGGVVGELAWWPGLGVVDGVAPVVSTVGVVEEDAVGEELQPAGRLADVQFTVTQVGADDAVDPHDMSLAGRRPPTALLQASPEAVRKAECRGLGTPLVSAAISWPFW